MASIIDSSIAAVLELAPNGSRSVLSIDALVSSSLNSVLLCMLVHLHCAKGCLDS